LEGISIYPVRLVSGNNTSLWYGRVEIYYVGRWGAVCDTGWGYEEANVVCRQLGFSGTDSAALCELFITSYNDFFNGLVADSVFGSSNGTIWIDKVNCHGNENGLSQCRYDGWGIPIGLGFGYCQHTEEASVVCSKSKSACKIHYCILGKQ